MKISSILLLILTGTMITTMPIKSYADPQLDTLLNIATQARDSLSITISQISNVPDGINQLYKQGSNETDALAQAVSQQDVAAAKQHFLAAMQFFKETNDQINSLNATAPTDQQRAETEQLKGEVVRLENMGNLLKSIATQNSISINFTDFDVMIQNATQDINSGNLDDASKQLQKANSFIITTHNSLTQAAQQKISQRARDFTEKQIAQLSSTQASTAPQNSTTSLNNTKPSNVVVPSQVPKASTNAVPPTPPETGSNVTMNSNPKAMVDELKHLVAEGKVDQAINLIKMIQAYQREKMIENQAAERPAAPSNTTVTSPPTNPPPAPVQENNTEPAPSPAPSNTPTPPSNTTVTSPPTNPPPAPVQENNTEPTPPPSNATNTLPPSHQNHTSWQDQYARNHDHLKKDENTRHQKERGHNDG